jgi:hypothetical protein
MTFQVSDTHLAGKRVPRTALHHALLLEQSGRLEPFYIAASRVASQARHDLNLASDHWLTHNAEVTT